MKKITSFLSTFEASLKVRSCTPNDSNWYFDDNFSIKPETYYGVNGTKVKSKFG